MASSWGVGRLQPALGTKAFSLVGMAGKDSCRFKGHFTLVTSLVREHHQLRTSVWVSVLQSILFSMLSSSFIHVVTPNQSLEPTAGRCDDQI